MHNSLHLGSKLRQKDDVSPQLSLPMTKKNDINADGTFLQHALINQEENVAIVPREGFPTRKE
jgi:hypothetical protein